MYICFNRPFGAAFLKKACSKPVLLALLGFLIGFDTYSQQVQQPTDHFATVNGLKLHYQECGNGTPLIFLHAFTRSSSDWEGFAGLAQHFRMIAIDNRLSTK
jgi:hypothetical protein